MFALLLIAGDLLFVYLCLAETLPKEKRVSSTKPWHQTLLDIKRGYGNFLVVAAIIRSCGASEFDFLFQFALL